MTIEAVPCSHPGCVDLRDVRYPGDGVLHLTTADWAEFLATVKRGDLDALAESANPSEMLKRARHTASGVVCEVRGSSNSGQIKAV